MRRKSDSLDHYSLSVTDRERNEPPPECSSIVLLHSQKIKLAYPAPQTSEFRIPDLLIQYQRTDKHFAEGLAKMVTPTWNTFTTEMVLSLSS